MFALVADAFLQSSINARCIALDYALWIHRWDMYKYLHAPYDYGYGYGGYGGYPYAYGGAGCGVGLNTLYTPTR